MKNISKFLLILGLSSFLHAGHCVIQSSTSNGSSNIIKAHRAPVKHVKCWRVYFWDRYGFYRSTIKCNGANTISY